MSADAALGWPCPTADEMRAIDRDAIQKRGIPGRLLMETAGRAVARAIRREHPGLRRPLVLCGSGNNGGDGLVVARALQEGAADMRPRVVGFGDPARRSPETAANTVLWTQAGGELLQAPALDDLKTLLADSDAVVDALFGVGLARPVEGDLAQAVEAVNASRLPCIAVDVPSGLCSDTGRELGVAIRPTLVVTLGLPKLGLALRSLGAPVWVADIGLPDASVQGQVVRQEWVRPEAVARRLPARSLEGHKGRFGHVLVVAGSEGKSGAAALAARGALRAGAGLVTLACPRAVLPVLALQVTEAMTLPIGEADLPSFVGGETLERLVAEAALRDVVVVGPGIGTAAETTRCIRDLLRRSDRPAVVDADGLNAFGADLEALAHRAPRVLTPHPGEAARLLGCAAAEIQRDRAAAARLLARRSGAVVVLKGARSVIADPDGRLWINPSGGPGLASGGTGDVLAGVIGGLLAQGILARDAAIVGTYLHGRAGEARPVGLLAREVADGIPVVWQELRAASSSAHDDASLVRLPGS